MQADIELLIQPYSVPGGRSILQALIEELTKGNWKVFRAAVAFAKTSGNYEDLLRAMLGFAKGGGKIDLTFGADTFSGEADGSDYEAIRELLATLGNEPTVRIFLYHEKGRTFHPKVYLLANQDEKRALIVVGSSNWSTGGLWKNVEANVILRLDLSKKEHMACLEQVQQCFDNYWMEQTK
jgi:HKD family nuclease